MLHNGALAYAVPYHPTDCLWPRLCFGPVRSWLRTAFSPGVLCGGREGGGGWLEKGIT